MGSRDDNVLDDDGDDIVMRQALRRAGEFSTFTSPPDLVGGVLGRLPQLPPEQAARMIRRHRARHRMLLGAVLAFVLVLAVYGLLVSLHLVPQPAFMLGDGSDGFSRLVLLGTLLVKPALAALTHASPLLAVLGLIVVFGGGWLWWRLVRGDREGQEALR